MKFSEFQMPPDVQKMSGTAGAFKNIGKKTIFDHLIYIHESKIHFLVHRFRGRRLPEKH